MDFRRVRNRIEQFFARIDKHRFMWYNCHDEEWNRQAFGLMFNAECVSCEDDDVRLTNEKSSPLYPTVKFEASESDHVRKWEDAPDCECNFPKIEPKSEHAVIIKAYRQELITFIRAEYGDTVVMRKASKKAKSGAVSRPAHSRAELKELFGARRAARQAERKLIKKATLEKKRAAKKAKKRAEDEEGAEPARKPKRAKTSTKKQEADQDIREEVRKNPVPAKTEMYKMLFDTDSE